MNAHGEEQNCQPQMDFNPDIVVSHVIPFLPVETACRVLIGTRYFDAYAREHSRAIDRRRGLLAWKQSLERIATLAVKEARRDEKLKYVVSLRRDGIPLLTLRIDRCVGVQVIYESTVMDSSEALDYLVSHAREYIDDPTMSVHMRAKYSSSMLDAPAVEDAFEEVYAQSRAAIERSFAGSVVDNGLEYWCV